MLKLTKARATTTWVCGVMMAWLVLALPANVFSCLWDYDTLREERRRFPSTLELITGKFPRHSTEFYQWRIKDRLERLKSDPQNLDDRDDLAVAYQKAGQHDRAIEVMLEKEKIKPGEYKTYSNLGTFYILAGDFDKGLPYIDKALAIDPNAHFGREKYQKWLVEYAQSRRQEGKLQFPLRRQQVAGADFKPDHITDFADFLRLRHGVKDLSHEQIRKARAGIEGMMRFANYDNPLLLEALADVLMCGENEVNARQLAARSYLQASYAVTDKNAAKRYQDIADVSLEQQIGSKGTQRKPLAQLEREFKSELVYAEKWYAEFKRKELKLIKGGDQVEAQFDKLADM